MKEWELQRKAKGFWLQRYVSLGPLIPHAVCLLFTHIHSSPLPSLLPRHAFFRPPPSPLPPPPPQPSSSSSSPVSKQKAQPYALYFLVPLTGWKSWPSREHSGAWAERKGYGLSSSLLAVFSVMAISPRWFRLWEPLHYSCNSWVTGHDPSSQISLISQSSIMESSPPSLPGPSASLYIVRPCVVSWVVSAFPICLKLVVYMKLLLFPWLALFNIFYKVIYNLKNSDTILM